MGTADMIGIGIIIVFAVAGWFLGTVRSGLGVIGMLVAMTMITKMFIPGAPVPTMGKLVGTFGGVTVVFLVAGILLYGATRMSPIESMEGVFGTILGAVLGWGIARFVFIIYVVYYPSSQVSTEVLSGLSVASDIYNVSPVVWLQEKIQFIRNSGNVGGTDPNAVQ